jgi:hypothetical protein
MLFALILHISMDSLLPHCLSDYSQAWIQTYKQGYYYIMSKILLITQPQGTYVMVVVVVMVQTVII